MSPMSDKPDREQEVREARAEVLYQIDPNDIGCDCHKCERSRSCVDRFEAAVRADERAKSELERLSALRGAYLDTAIHHSPCPECDNAVKRLNEEIRHLGL